MSDQQPRAVTSASNIFRRALCPGSERLEAGLPDEDSDQSLEGTLLHKHAADPTLDRKKLKASQRDLLEVNDRLVREVFERVTNQFHGVGIAEKHGREQEFWLHRSIRSLFPGHIDLYEWMGGLLVILDYKFGFKVVTEASANLQLRSYAVMGAEQFPVEHCVVAITQPRLSGDDRLTMAVYSRADIEASRQQLYQIWDAAKAPDAPLVAGEEQCRYCKAALNLTCPAYLATIEKGTSIIPMPNASLSKPRREEEVEHKLRQCSDEQLARFLDAGALVTFTLDKAKDIARERIRAGGMPGYRLGKEKTIREITDVGQAVDLLTAEGLPREKIMAACSMSIGDDGGISEVYRTVKGGTWKDTRTAIDTLLSGVIERKTTKPSIEKVKALPA